MNKRNIIYPAIIFGLLSSLFFFGSFSKDYELEKNAKEIADVALTTRHKALLGIKAEALNDAELPDSETEYLYLYQAFMMSNYATYAPVANSNKEVDYRLEGVSDGGSLSFLRFDYASSIVSENRIRHKRYPIEYMFEDKPFYDEGYSNVIAINDKQADSILKSRGKEAPYTLEDYKSLTLYSDSPSTVNLTYGDGNKLECYVGNIFIKNEREYFYAYVKEVLDDFVIAYKTVPSNVKKENLYFLNKYAYQNKYFMNHINEKYKDKDNFKISIVKNNLTSEVNEQSLLNFYYGDLGFTNWVAILVTTFVALGCASITLLSTLKDKLYKSKKFNLLFFSSLILPYLIFRVVNAISGSTLFFSWFSTTANIITALCIVLLYLASIAIYKIVTNKKENSNNEREN